MCDHDALGVGGRPGSVLQEGHVGRARLRLHEEGRVRVAQPHLHTDKLAKKGQKRRRDKESELYNIAHLSYQGEPGDVALYIAH